VRLAVLMAALAAAAITGTHAPAQDTSKCRLVKVGGAGFVQQCGDRLHAFGLSMPDIRRTAPQGNDPQGWFTFGCPFEPLCADEPEIRGAFFDAVDWQKSAKDAQAVWDVVERRSSLHIRGEPANSPCEAFDVSIAGLAGRAVCYQSGQPVRSAILVVAADGDIGFILIFLRPEQDWTALRDKVVQLLPRFTIGRASGDAALLGWLR
jgi:hypothetical protein